MGSVPSRDQVRPLRWGLLLALGSRRLAPRAVIGTFAGAYNDGSLPTEPRLVTAMVLSVGNPLLRRSWSVALVSPWWIGAKLG